MCCFSQQPNTLKAHALLGVAQHSQQALATNVSATTFTETSPFGGTVPTGITPVGGLVLELQGVSGNRVFA
jgi:hypothetical protein